MNVKGLIAIAAFLSCQLHTSVSQQNTAPYQFLLNLTVEPTQLFPFDPDEALKNRVIFEKKYGRRGERLIESFGSVSDSGTEKLVPENGKQTSENLP